MVAAVSPVTNRIVYVPEEFLSPEASISVNNQPSLRRHHRSSRRIYDERPSSTPFQDCHKTPPGTCARPLAYAGAEIGLNIGRASRIDSGCYLPDDVYGPDHVWRHARTTSVYPPLLPSGLCSCQFPQATSHSPICPIYSCEVCHGYHGHAPQLASTYPQVCYRHDCAQCDCPHCSWTDRSMKPGRRGRGALLATAPPSFFSEVAQKMVQVAAVVTALPSALTLACSLPSRPHCPECGGPVHEARERGPRIRPAETPSHASKNVCACLPAIPEPTAQYRLSNHIAMEA